MLKTIVDIKSQFLNLLEKIDLNSEYILNDKEYVKVMAEEIAQIYVMLNESVCEELSMCHTCMQQSDYLRDMMLMFEELEDAKKLDATIQNRYKEFASRLEDIINKIDTVILEVG